MNLQMRPYRDATDLACMRQFLVEGKQANTLASYMHPGYLDFDTHYPPDEQENRRDFLLWERMDTNEGQPTLEAWAMFWRNEGAFDLFVSPALHGTPEHTFVMNAYLRWAEARARAAGLTQLAHYCIFDNDTVMKRMYESHGFVAIPADPELPLFERSLDDLPTMPLPDGYTVQGVHNLDDGRLRARVTHGAFDLDANWEKYAQFIASALRSIPAPPASEEGQGWVVRKSSVSYLVVLCSRQPGTYIWLMVIMEMVKEFTRAEALTAQLYNMIRWLDQDVIG